MNSLASLQMTARVIRATKRVLGLSLLSLLMVGSIAVNAQTATVSWTQNNVASIAQAQSFTYKLYVTPSGTTTQNTAVVLVSVSCTGTAPSVNCQAALPAAASMATVTGAKSSLTSTDTVGGTGESVQSAPFTPGASVPGGLKIG